MISFLVFGFLIGMSHALEADHLAAVGALEISGRSSPLKLAFLGASWGGGHTTALLLLSLLVLGFGYVLSNRLAAGMEFAVGAMLIVLGCNVFWKIHKSRIHFHIHQHGDGEKHFHAHSHANKTLTHNKDPHIHKHGFSLKAYLVGLAHGAAGSAGLIALTAAATRDLVTALSYVLVFGIGSIFGMALLTYAVSWPMRLSEKTAGRFFKITQGAIATFAIYIGANILITNAAAVWGGV